MRPRPRATFTLGVLAAVQLLSGCAGNPAPRTSTTSATLTWRDEASARGLVFRHSTGVPRHLNIAQATGSGGGFLDYDNDGWLDVYLVQGDTASAGGGRLFHNRGDGTFEDVTETSGIISRDYGMGMAIGDYNGDGLDDLYLCNLGPDQLYRNLGDGKFQEVTREAGIGLTGWSSSAAFFDADRDGDLDLYVCRYAQFSSKERQLCFPEGIPTSCTPRHYAALPDVFFENLGNGRFRDATAAAGMKDLNGRTLGIAVADFDNDGNSDLLLTNDGTADVLWRGDGRGHFRDIAGLTGIAYNSLGKSTASMGVSVGDVNGDGRQDVLIGNFQNESDSLFLNEGAAFVESSVALGLAQPSLPTLTFGVAFVDWDNDGRLDTLQANGHVQDRIAEIDSACAYRQPRQFFQQAEDGTLRDHSDSAGPALTAPDVSRAIALGDIDNDGKMDALFTTLDGAPRLLINQAPPAKWLKIALQGTRGNPRGIGARIVCTAGTRKSIADVSASGGFAASWDPRTNFGFGALNQPVKIEVRWPDGARTVRSDVALNQTLVIKR